MAHYRLLLETGADGGLASPGFSQETSGLSAAHPAPSSSYSSASVRVWDGKGLLQIKSFSLLVTAVWLTDGAR